MQGDIELVGIQKIFCSSTAILLDVLLLFGLRNLLYTPKVQMTYVYANLCTGVYA